MDTSMKEYMIENAEANGREALTTARAALERAIKEIDRYAARYDEMSGADKGRVLEWAINYLASSVIPNCRLDMLANAQAAIATAHAMPNDSSNK